MATEDGRTGAWLDGASKALRSLPLAGAAPRGIETQLLGHARVAIFARGRELEHPRHVALAEDWLAEDVVMHVAAPGGKAGVLDVAHDLDFVHAVARAGGADDILLDHHAAHVVRAVREAQLADLAALGHPGGLQVVEIVEDDPRERERAEIVEAGRLGAAQ